ncbi:MAG: lysoplasmalogenase family protein [Brevefilum sp.]
MTDAMGWLTGIVFSVFLVDWLAVGFSWRKVECVFKPLSMLMVILWTLATARWSSDLLLILLVGAQLAGLTGDVLLLLSPRWFLLGLGAFLLGHLAYIGLMGAQIHLAVRAGGLQAGWVGWLALIVVMFAVMLALFYHFIAPKSPRLTMPLTLWIPIQVYGWILGGLVIAALLVTITAESVSLPVLLLPLGALLFFVSDSLLAYDRFKRKLPKIRAWIMVTYHLAQFCLAAGFLAAMGFIGV